MGLSVIDPLVGRWPRLGREIQIMPEQRMGPARSQRSSGLGNGSARPMEVRAFGVITQGSSLQLDDCITLIGSIQPDVNCAAVTTK